MRIEINDKNPGELVIIGEHELDFMRMEKVFMNAFDDYAIRHENVAGNKFKLVIEMKRKEK